MNAAVDDDGTSGIVVGNAGIDGLGAPRGWFVGHFVDPPASLRRTDAVEVKWGVHPAGQTRPGMAAGMAATTLSILISGAFRLLFQDREVRLTRPGDYVLFAPGVSHSWRAEEDSVVLTVRWPSKPGEAGEASPQVIVE